MIRRWYEMERAILADRESLLRAIMQVAEPLMAAEPRTASDRSDTITGYSGLAVYTFLNTDGTWCLTVSGEKWVVDTAAQRLVTHTSTGAVFDRNKSTVIFELR